MGRRTDGAIDWELVERDYRTGQHTLRQLASLHDVQPSAISRRAKAKGWTQDTAKAVRSRTEALLSSAKPPKAPKTAPKAADADLPVAVDIEVAALQRMSVVLAHREDACRMRSLAGKMLAELEEQTGDGQRLLHEIHRELLKTEGATQAQIAKASRALDQAISLEPRGRVLKSLADAVTKTVAIERQAFQLDDQPPAPPSAPDATATVESLAKLKAAFDKFAQEIPHAARPAA